MCNAIPHLAYFSFQRPIVHEDHGACASTSSNVGRIVGASYDLDFPAVQFPSMRIIDVVGEPALRQLVRRHHNLLRESEIKDLFSADDAIFAATVEKIADFVVESCGGSQNYSRKQEKGCMRTRHFPFLIDEAARGIWLSCLWQALQKSEFSQIMRQEYWNWMEPFSIRMINRRTLRGQPDRYPFELVQLGAEKHIFAVHY
jgi:hemoglobin